MDQNSPQPPLPDTTIRPNAKHVSRACLQCRVRHSKCDGKLPVCTRCESMNRECTYVKSNRGGSRKKGVSKLKGTEKRVSSTSTSTTRSVDIEDTELPCAKTPQAHLSQNCSKDCLKPENATKTPSCMSWYDNKPPGGMEFHPKFNASKQAFDWKQDQFFRNAERPAVMLPKLTKDLNVTKIVEDYYKHFHNAHPFLPPKNEIFSYLSRIPDNYDLLLAMKIMGTGQATNKYSKDIETVQFLVENVVEYIRSVGKDLVSLQAMLLLSMVTHISSLHDFSVAIRRELMRMAFEFQLHRLDQDKIEGEFVDANGFLTNGATLPKTAAGSVVDKLGSARRLERVPKDVLLETARRTLWDVYFFDTLSGTATGFDTSLLASETLLTFYPSSPLREVFDYKTRAESCKLVNDAIKLNVTVLTKEGDVGVNVIHMRAAVDRWQMKIDNPEMFNAPSLVTKSGQVNEGVHQSIILGSYAKIFTHRPFSYLWRPDQTKSEKFSSPASKVEESTKIIETRKAIDSANSVAKTLIETNLSRVTSRTPFFACSLAFATLVHLSAYSWVESSLSYVSQNKNSSLAGNVTKDELDVYVMYITLELNGIYAISRHWNLSAKLISHIKETLAKVSPQLYASVKPSFVENKQIAVKVEDEPPVKNDLSMTPLPQGEKWSSISDDTSTFASDSPAMPFSESSPSSSLKTFQAPSYASNSGGFSIEQIISNDAPPTNWPAPEKPKPVNLLEEADYSSMFGSVNKTSLSPFADTGCDWVDKNMDIFEFDDFNFLDIDET
ncbi:unnamed protein product [Kuraishia capsulata CBS 1993]|uniref:Zn(2)-C6 fungal-type domain-containing protein n=1 Tax=Kuraishia capsulata CBS 1993 TaxID=1382522 RepID=W6MF95_9ASCO|nr:uncharacterized protein KUCA_T00000101001 [Kuraishia capsulata CBS 1993]CDK24141.1 unnamed protein product [Kuraishia capsulata CBS 1993]